MVDKESISTEEKQATGTANPTSEGDVTNVLYIFSC